MDPALFASYATGPQTLAEAYPPICLRTHWDPTMLVRHVLPERLDPYPQQLDPRQAVKVSTAYYDQSPAPSSGSAPVTVENSRVTIPPALLMSERQVYGPYNGVPYLPPGGAYSKNVPFPVYQQSVDDESRLQLLNLPLVKCPAGKYLPTAEDVRQTKDQRVVPGTSALSGGYYNPEMNNTAPFEGPRQRAGCREVDDAEAWQRSSRVFFNPTKYDRTTMVPAHLRVAESRYALAKAQGTRLTT